MRARPRAEGVLLLALTQQFPLRKKGSTYTVDQDMARLMQGTGGKHYRPVPRVEEQS
jgi:hypothetical protein